MTVIRRYISQDGTRYIAAAVIVRCTGDDAITCLLLWSEHERDTTLPPVEFLQSLRARTRGKRNAGKIVAEALTRHVNDRENALDLWDRRGRMEIQSDSEYETTEQRAERVAELDLWEQLDTWATETLDRATAPPRRQPVGGAT